MNFIGRMRNSIIAKLAVKYICINRTEYVDIVRAANKRFNGRWYSNEIEIKSRDTFTLSSTSCNITTIDTYTDLKLVEIKEVNYKGNLHGRVLTIRGGNVMSVKLYDNGRKIKTNNG